MSSSRLAKLGFLSVCVLLVGGSFRTTAAQVMLAPGTRIDSAVRQAEVRTANVRMAQGLRGTARDARPLPSQIIATPGVGEKLEVIQRRSQLMITRTPVVRTAIADSSVIDVVQYSPTEIAVIGLELGTTTLTLWFEDSRDPLIYLVRVIPDPSIEEQRRIDYGKLERKIAELFPNSKVHLIPLSRKIVVTGQARDGEESARILEIVRGELINQYGSLFGPQPGAAGGAGLGAGLGIAGDDFGTGFNGLDFASSLIVNMLEVPGEFQVQLRVRIAELNRQELRQMGVDWSVLFGDGQQFVGAALGGGAPTLTGIFENGDINVLLNWLASNGTIKILSEPTMTVLSGHNASFLSGGEFAVPTIVGVGGAQGQQTTFRGFGTSLIATPTVIDRDLIRMRIVPEFSQINQGNAVGGVPGVDSRRIQTTVELREGQTLAIAGLIARQTSTEVTRIPWLGEIPWVGPLVFNSKRATEDETELLILVSPEIVRPMEADEVPPVPGFEVTHPTDHDLYKRAMTEGAPDLQYYQLAPFGRGAGHGIPVGYKLFEPSPASPSYPPQPTSAYKGSSPYPVSRDGVQYTPAGPAHSHTPHGHPSQPTPTPRTWTQPSQPQAPYQPHQVLPQPAPRGAMPPSPTPLRTAPPSPSLGAPSLGVPAPALDGPSARAPYGFRTSQRATPADSSWSRRQPTGEVRPTGYQSSPTGYSTSTPRTTGRRFSR